MRIGKSFAKYRRRLVIGAVTLASLIAIGVYWTSIEVPSFANVRDRYQPSDLWIVDQDGKPMESIRAHGAGRSLDWISWSDVSPAFRDLLVRVEDQRFYSHIGVDVWAIAGAIRERAIGSSKRGASTITMQLVGLLLERTGSRRTWAEKFAQMASALKLEASWSKEEILEAYVNLVPFRGELSGLRAAALGYFSKNPSGLTEEEAALLVALIRSPNSAADLVGKRTCLILGLDDCAKTMDFVQLTLKQPYSLARTRELVPVLSKSFTTGRSEGLIRTSLDARVQEFAMRALRDQLRELKKQNVGDGAVLVLETETGRVVAYIANAGTGFSSAEQIDGIQTRRQAGSTIKPFVYATAFDWRILTPSSLLEDSPADISVDNGRVYHPKNYDHIFRGMVSASDSLGSSLNVPAVRTLGLVGEERVLEKLQASGFAIPHQEENYYGPSLALGAIDLTLWELTQGYRQFASEASPFSAVTRSSIFQILSAPEHRRHTFGMESLLSLPFAAAVKTGTSKDMRDNWCIGWTPRYTVGVWVGNFNGQPMWNVSGMTGAAPIWKSLMLALHPGFEGSLSRYEAPSEPLPERTISRIRYPAPNMLVGLDPDIPSPLQKLPIEVENPQKGDGLYLNNRLLAQSQATTLMAIKKGKFRIDLKSARGDVKDSVAFEVR